MKRLRVVFMGTPDFAVPCLETLYQNTDVLAVFTQPDKPKGRGKKLSSPPVKVYAETQHVPVLQPKTLRDEEIIRDLKALAPELIVVVAYGKILPPEVLAIPKYGAINVHASLLPKYRGAAPMQQAILNGETKTGITTMFMDAGLDTGDILLQREVPILPDMNAGELSTAMQTVGAELLAETLQHLIDGTLQRIPQKDEGSSYASMLSKDMGRIDWTQDADSLHNLVRGLNPWPCAFTYWHGKRIKIWRTRIVERSGKAGKIFALTKAGFLVGTGNQALEILEVQAPGKRRMAASDFVHGHGLAVGDGFANEIDEA